MISIEAAKVDNTPRNNIRRQGFEFCNEFGLPIKSYVYIS